MAGRPEATQPQLPNLELVVRQGPQPGQRFRLSQATLKLGRGSGNDIILADAQISRRHARLTWDGRQWIVEDLGSANGTYVNGLRLTAPQALRQGDLIGLGPNLLLGVQAGGPVGGPAAATGGLMVPAPPPVTPRSQVAVHQPRRRRWFWIPVAVGLLGCVLALLALVAYPLISAQPETIPAVLIGSPRHGRQAAIGEDLTVHAVARDETKVVRLELWSDGKLVEAQTSPRPEGLSPFPLLARWWPSASGTHSLIVRAFNTRGARGQASVQVKAMEVADRDGDGVPDGSGATDDACPDAPGSPLAEGCPDADGDGVADEADLCPGEAGLPESGGCPVPGDGDRDGDGVREASDAGPDEAGGIGGGGDACPDEPGSPLAEGCPDADGDGVHDRGDACPAEPGPAEHSGCPPPGDRDADGLPDDSDLCPDEPGTPEHAGCPDRDGDGIRDLDDACPGEPGAPEHAGCPDRDGDGIRDLDDACPDTAGLAPSGCPDTGAGDGDGDGVPDDADLCPGEPGLPGHAGCPPPEDEGDSGDGSPGEDGSPGRSLPLWPPPGILESLRVMIPVEVEALAFGLGQAYDEVYCYVGLAGQGMERYGPFEALDQNRWDIATDLGGENSRRILVLRGEELELQMACGAYRISREESDSPTGFGDIGESAAYYDLGSLTHSHPAAEWDGRELQARSEREAEPLGQTFWVDYRLCSPSCEEAALPPAHLWSTVIAGEKWLLWSWTGDPEAIDGFRAHYDCYSASGGFWRGATLATPQDSYSRSIQSFPPPPGGRCEWTVWAYRRSDGAESPRSNVVIWEGAPVREAKVVNVQLRGLAEGVVLEPGHGPIYGDFFVNDEVLHFDAAYYSLGAELGLPMQTIAIADLFDWIRLRQASHSWVADQMEAPSTERVAVTVPEGEELTLGLRIMEYHHEGADVELCRYECSLAYEEIVDTSYYACPPIEEYHRCYLSVGLEVFGTSVSP